jgi:hypothetical protein
MTIPETCAQFHVWKIKNNVNYKMNSFYLAKQALQVFISQFQNNNDLN